MSWLRRTLSIHWLETMLIIGLLIVIGVAGLTGLILNNRIRDVTDHALGFDIQLEDRGDDLQVAVLDMRHYHRNLIFAGPTRRGMADFQSAYSNLLERIDALEELGLDDPRVASPTELHDLADSYYEEFIPAVDEYGTDLESFTIASDAGLVRLASLEAAAREIDELGQQRSTASVNRLTEAANSEQLVLLVVLGSLVPISIGLVYLTGRVLREQKHNAAELARALELKTNFIADASHELRTPLTVLRANAEVALTLDRTCVHTELLEEIVHESERMTRLVEDLLFLARSDTGLMPLDLEPVPIVPFVRRLGERAEMLAAQYGTSLTLELNGEGTVWLDRHRIEQVLLILVDNAARHGPPGVPITLRSVVRAEEVVLSVEDRGNGVPTEELPHLFERFYRVDRSRARRGGTGLGLSIAKRIIEFHEGQIEAESVLNEGMTVHVRLPLSQGVPAEQPVPSPT